VPENFDLTGLVQPGAVPAAAVKPAAAATGDQFDLSGLVEPAADKRSAFAKAVDWSLEPIGPAKALSEASSNWWQRNFAQPREGEGVMSYLGRRALGTTADLAAQAVAGIGSPMGLATLGSEGAAAGLARAAGKAAAPTVVRGLTTAAQAARGVGAASSAAFGARGAERMAESESLGEFLQGALEAGMGYLGVKHGLQSMRAPVAAAEAPAAEAAAAPAAAAAPVIAGERPPLTPEETREVRRMVEEMETLGFGKRQFKEARYGGAPEVSGGYAGAPVYQDIVHEMPSPPSRQDVLNSMRGLLEGKGSATGDRALEVARLRAAGSREVSKPYLGYSGEVTPEEATQLQARRAANQAAWDAAEAVHPRNVPVPEVPPVPREVPREIPQEQLPQGALTATRASDFRESGNYDVMLPGGETTQIYRDPESKWWYEHVPGKHYSETVLGFTKKEALDKLAARREGAAFGGLDKAFEELAGGVGPESLGPGEAGKINPILAARLGLGGTGAAYGAATGDTPQDRAKRALIYGVVGAAAPSLLTSPAETQAQRVYKRVLQQPPEYWAEVPEEKAIQPSRLVPPKMLGEDPLAQEIWEESKGFQTQRRNVQPVARTKALADRIGINLDQDLKPGTTLNAAQMTALGNATKTMMDRAAELNTLVQGGQATPELVAELADTRQTAARLSKNLAGVVTEAGRSLHISRFLADVLAQNDPEKVALTKKVMDGGFGEEVKKYFYANILSGFGTQERNILGNVSNLTFNLASRPLAAGADVIRSAVTGGPRTTFLGEVPERVAATVKALPEAFRDALSALKTGSAAEESINTFDRPNLKEMKLGPLTGGQNPLNWPTRALNAADDFFAKLAHSQAEHGLAYRQAKLEGLSGQEFNDRMAFLRENPTPPMQEMIDKEAAQLLFREKPGRIAQGALALKKYVPELDYVLPFVRVPANIMRQGLEASPAALLMKGVRAGGAQGAEAMGRAALGSLALAPLAYWAAMGNITGSAPSDPAERETFYADGKRPNSIRIGNTWYNYQAIQPLAVPLSIIANGFQAYRSAANPKKAKLADQILIDALGGTGKSLLDQSFLSGVSALNEALSDPERAGKQFVHQFLQGFVPFSGAMRNVAQTVDPVVRTPETIAQGLETIVPGLSKNVPPRLNRFGEPTVRTATPFNILQPSPVINDPLNEVLKRAGVDLRPSTGPKMVNLGRLHQVPLSQEEQTQAGEETGQAVQRVLQAVVTQPGFENLPPEFQKLMIDSYVTRARGAAHQALLRRAIQSQLQGAR